MRARTQIIISLLVITAILTVGAFYLRTTTDMVQQMPRESVQWLQKGLSAVRKNRQKAVKAGSDEIKKRTNQLKQFFKTKKQKEDK